MFGNQGIAELGKLRSDSGNQNADAIIGFVTGVARAQVASRDALLDFRFGSDAKLDRAQNGNHLDRRFAEFGRRRGDQCNNHHLDRQCVYPAQYSGDCDHGRRCRCIR